MQLCNVIRRVVLPKSNAIIGMIGPVWVKNAELVYCWRDFNALTEVPIYPALKFVKGSKNSVFFPAGMSKVLYMWFSIFLYIQPLGF